MDPGSAAEFVRAVHDDPADVRAGIERFGPRPVLDAVADAVGSGDRDAASLALAVLRDGILRAGHAELARAYRRSALLDLLRAKLLAPDYALRGSAVYTLGKLGPRENTRHLLAALPWYREHDPLRLDALLFELSGLAGRRGLDRRGLVTELARSPAYLTRWATVRILWDRELGRGRPDGGAGRTPGWAVQLLRGLARDPQPDVRGDAVTALAERRRRAVEPEQAGLRIELVEALIASYLYASGEADYDVGLVEAVARHAASHPVPPEYDARTYWAPLAAGRA